MSTPAALTCPALASLEHNSPVPLALELGFWQKHYVQFCLAAHTCFCSYVISAVQGMSPLIHPLHTQGSGLWLPTLLQTLCWKQGMSDLIPLV